jgi:cobalt-zinc-cadmium efflux system protein
MTGHGGHSHQPAVTGPRSARHLTGALTLILMFMVGEVIVGILASSLALISDAGHMLTDASRTAV